MLDKPRFLSIYIYPTCLINSIKHEHSCKIRYLNQPCRINECVQPTLFNSLHAELIELVTTDLKSNYCFQRISFKNTFRVSNSLDPNQEPTLL